MFGVRQLSPFAEVHIYWTYSLSLPEFWRWSVFSEWHSETT